MKYFKYLLLILLITLFSIQKSQAERKKKILVLHSYHQGLEWTDNVSRGIEDIFSPLRSQYEVYYEYLDSKRNAGNAYLQQSASFISTKNSQEKYEIVIAVDNNALKLLNSRQITFLGSPPIVFCGINNYDDSLISELDQVTGIVETTDHFSTLDIMHKLHPDKKTSPSF
ncbi:hypothetical protein [Vibrio algarum]|uniref:Uncharacterized protein n=1 Tax=Vibrio algarum TaxID=3020714 RepID=A0ABT4YSD2_9VIBR|nr:hypothetical protein [Vibrio sp. KJ40-1]MDB1124444.1 hypothetical protein [Vibrio sp. KJ40-1]